MDMKGLLWLAGAGYVGYLLGRRSDEEVALIEEEQAIADAIGEDVTEADALAAAAAEEIMSEEGASGMYMGTYVIPDWDEALTMAAMGYGKNDAYGGGRYGQYNLKRLRGPRGGYAGWEGQNVRRVLDRAGVDGPGGMKRAAAAVLATGKLPDGRRASPTVRSAAAAMVSRNHELNELQKRRSKRSSPKDRRGEFRPIAKRGR